MFNSVRIHSEYALHDRKVRYAVSHDDLMFFRRSGVFKKWFFPVLLAGSVCLGMTAVQAGESGLPPSENGLSARQLTVQAESGDADARFALGTLYYYGKGVLRDYQKAAYWYRKAADQGNALAQYALGAMYGYGEGIGLDYGKAVHWFRKAAEQGNADAQQALGIMYDWGKGVSPSHEKAVYWYRKAADQGNALAQKKLAIKIVRASCI